MEFDFDSGEFFPFVTVKAFHLPRVANLEGRIMKLGARFSFDGSTLRFGREEIHAPQMVGAVRAGWAVLETDDPVEVNTARRQAPLKMNPITPKGREEAKAAGRDPAVRRPIEMVSSEDRVARDLRGIVKPATPQGRERERAAQASSSYRVENQEGQVVARLAKPAKQPRINLETQQAQVRKEIASADRNPVGAAAQGIGETPAHLKREADQAAQRLSTARSKRASSALPGDDKVTTTAQPSPGTQTTAAKPAKRPAKKTVASEDTSR